MRQLQAEALHTAGACVQTVLGWPWAALTRHASPAQSTAAAAGASHNGCGQRSGSVPDGLRPGLCHVARAVHLAGLHGAGEMLAGDVGVNMLITLRWCSIRIPISTPLSRAFGMLTHGSGEAARLPCRLFYALPSALITAS